MFNKKHNTDHKFDRKVDNFFQQLKTKYSLFLDMKYISDILEVYLVRELIKGFQRFGFLSEGTRKRTFTGLKINRSWTL